MIRGGRRLLVLALTAGLVAGCAGTGSGEQATLHRFTEERAASSPAAPGAGIAPAGDGALPAPAPAVQAPTPVDEAARAGVDLDAVPRAADDPAGLAEQIHTAEQAIRDPATPPAEIAYYGHLQQVAYRALAERPDWDDAVAAALPEELRPVMAANVFAGRELRRPHRKPEAMLPAWRIVDPPPPDELRRYYEEGQAIYGVPWQYLAAVNLTETRMGRIRGTSSAGAQGPMQFIPSTWAAYGEGDINDPRDAILAAARYLAANGGGSGNLSNALYRYNPAQWYVKAVTAYAEQMVADERAYLGYHAWQVYYLTNLGDVLLPVGYEATAPRPVTPADLAG